MRSARSAVQQPVTNGTVGCSQHPGRYLGPASGKKGVRSFARRRFYDPLPAAASSPPGPGDAGDRHAPSIGAGGRLEVVKCPKSCAALVGSPDDWQGPGLSR